MTKHENHETLKDLLQLARETNALVTRPEVRQTLATSERFLGVWAGGTADPAEWNPQFWVHLCQVSLLPDTVANYSLRLLIQHCLKLNGLEVSLVEAS